MSDLDFVLILFMVNLPNYCHSISHWQYPKDNQISSESVMMSQIPVFLFYFTCIS